MATAKKNTEIYEEVRCDFDAELLFNPEIA